MLKQMKFGFKTFFSCLVSFLSLSLIIPSLKFCLNVFERKLRYRLSTSINIYSAFQTLNLQKSNFPLSISHFIFAFTIFHSSFLLLVTSDANVILIKWYSWQNFLSTNANWMIKIHYLTFSWSKLKQSLTQSEK